MSANVSVQLDGGDAVLRALMRLGVDVGQVLEAAALAGGQVLAVRANADAPEPIVRAEVAERDTDQAVVDIGLPRDKWYLQFFETGASEHEITGAPLAFEGEDGPVITGRVDHPGMAAEPFLRPAMDTGQGEATDAVGARVRRVL